MHTLHPTPSTRLALGNVIGDINSLVIDEPIAAADNDELANLVQVIVGLDGEFDIVYEKPANAQTVTLDLDDPDSGVSLDRTGYPRNTDVVITIDDQALNVDPTSDDVWFLNTNGDAYYRATDTGITDRANAEATLASDMASAAAQKVTDLAAAESPSDAIANALTERDRLRTIAQAAIDNPLLPDDNIQKTTAAEILGTGNPILASDGQTEITASIGTAQADYELIAGAPARGTVEATEGSAQSDYDVIVGKGGKNMPATVAFGDDAVATQIQMEDENFIGSAQYTYLRAIAVAGNTHTTSISNAGALPTTGIAGIEPLGITDVFDILDCVSPSCAAIEDTSGNDVTWVKFTETDSNESSFNNSPGDESNLKTKFGAQRGVSFSITYDNTATSGIGYTTTQHRNRCWRPMELWPGNRHNADGH